MKNMTTTQRAAIAKALTQAKTRLWDGKGPQAGKREFICTALDKGNGGRAALRVVKERIGKEGPMEAWLVRQGVAVKDLTPQRMQAHRLAWLDQLIREFA